ncbi:MAG: hypothetical protein MUP57_00140, partial [Clostridia bacterium]|nr:hypothetical protein [Clostridia bacterium]
MQLVLLWDLQELDLSISEFKLKIEEAPHLSGVEETNEKLDELKNELSEQEHRLKEDQKTLRQLEMKVQKIVDDRHELSGNLYSGKITNVKELEQMQRKLDLLAAEKQKLEDNIILLMESVEEQEMALKETETGVNKSKQEYQKKEGQLEVNLNLFRKELSRLETDRNRLAE